jgi:hypothetical protein
MDAAGARSANLCGVAVLPPITLGMIQLGMGRMAFGIASRQGKCISRERKAAGQAKGGRTCPAADLVRRTQSCDAQAQNYFFFFAFFFFAFFAMTELLC